MFTESFICYLHERDSFSGSQNSGLNFHSGNTLTLKKWLTAKRVDNFKYTLITMTSAVTN